ncbi:Acetylxylan esterase precursor [Stieleria neptunia]|uniref:Acetylxylan esterase n=1 Tax=Stieleria neptunia TaxID=2527979 RepID=A0A518HYL0_9BACT|nr:alpha/beta hydrolase [Stieleria neptunia]QDV45941.1 Acetylxylan esterase precursor [Stieleria neptunia]
MLRILFLSLLLTPLVVCQRSHADSPGEQAMQQLLDRDAVVIPLWPDDGGPPNQTQPVAAETVADSKSGKPAIGNVTKPSMVLFAPPPGVEATGTTILFAPGGAYGRLSLPNAVDVCHWAGAIGAHCAVLKYRVPRAADDPGHRVPLSDAQRAVRLLRTGAADLGIDGNKIIMIGSSAGGHLAFNLANNHDESTYPAQDAADQHSARPDAVVLMYPAYLTQPTGSLTADPSLHLDRLSPERTPPTLMTVTRSDKFTFGAVNTMLRLRQAKVPAELHVYPDGGHGGCFDKYPLMEFVRPAARFLKDHGMFTETMQQQSNAFLDRLQATFLKRNPVSGDVAKSAAAEIEPVTPSADWTAGDRQLAALRKPAPEIISLWPGDGKRADDPGAELSEELPQRPDGLVRITNVSRPTIHVWRPERPDGRAVILFPGGAYNALAAEHEGTQIAQWLCDQGITAFVTKYRVPRREGMDKHAVALQDAQRAIRLVRSRADSFNVDPQQIGVLGFSAGGNLATLTVHLSDRQSYPPGDSIDAVRANPDFAILIYPAYLTADDTADGLDPLIQRLKSSNDYPPIYLAVAADDRFAPDSLHYLLHLQRAKVPAELHVYASGGHGKGLREIGGPFAQWTQSCARWLADLQNGTTNVIVKGSR